MKGFTLIESVIVTAILIIATLIISVTFITLWQISQAHLLSFETKSQSSLALQKISEIIEEASEVLSSHIINGASYTTCENSLVLRLPSVTSDGEIISGYFDYASISIPSAQNLIADIEVSGGSARPSGQIILSNLAQSLNFRYNNSTPSEINAIEVFLETSKSAYDSDKISVLSTAAKLKNK
jgi:hypothetical protein